MIAEKGYFPAMLRGEFPTAEAALLASGFSGPEAEQLAQENCGLPAFCIGFRDDEGTLFWGAITVYRTQTGAFEAWDSFLGLDSRDEAHEYAEDLADYFPDRTVTVFAFGQVTLH
jgi:hypothetical protein